MLPLLLALAIPDDSDEPRPLPPPKFHSHRHHHHLGPSFRLLELERKFDAAKTAVVDVGICGAIPLLEKHADYCSKKEDDTERIRCIKDSLSSNIGGSRHEKVLLRQLLGVILLSAAAPFTDTDRQREMGDSQLEAWDYLGTTERQIEAESDVDMRSSIARLMGVGGSSTAKSQLYTKLAMETVGCLADIGKAAATAGATAAADVGQEVGKAALKGGAGSKGCFGLVMTLAQEVALRNGWNADSTWHIKGAVELQKAALKETEKLLAELPGKPSRSTQIAVKQILCVLTLFKTYFAHSGSKTIVSAAGPRTIEGDVVKTEGGTTFTRQLELGRVKRGSLMSKLTSYSAHEEVELVEAMMGELERLYTLLTQAIQREQVRLQLAAANAAEEVEWGEFQTAPTI